MVDVATDPTFFVCLTQDGRLHVHPISAIPQMSVGTPALQLPSNWALHSSPIVASTTVVVPAALIADLRTHGAASGQADDFWPFKGGSLSEEKIAPVPKLLISAYESLPDPRPRVVYLKLTTTACHAATRTEPFDSKMSLPDNSRYCMCCRSPSKALSAWSLAFTFAHPRDPSLWAWLREKCFCSDSWNQARP